MSKTFRRVLLGGMLLMLSVASVAAAQNAVGNLVSCDGGGRCEGSEERDIIVASNAAQEVIAKGGDDDIELDAVFPAGSDDVGLGGLGRDCIDGGSGDDLFIAGPGDDNRPCEFTAFVNPRAGLTGGPGDDVIDGGPGDDSMDGIADDDTLIGGEGNDLIEDFQPSDSDKLLGNDGDDELNATDLDDNDLIDGGAGKDNCFGDPGDTIRNCDNGTNRMGDDNGAATRQPSGAESQQGFDTDPKSFVALFGNARTTTALRGGLVTVPGAAVHCGVGPCQVNKQLFAARKAGTSSAVSGMRRGLVGRNRDVMAAGQTGQVRVRLSKSANRTLRQRGRMRVEVVVTVTDAKGRSELGRKTITVKRAS